MDLMQKFIDYNHNYIFNIALHYFFFYNDLFAYDIIFYLIQIICIQLYDFKYS